MYQNILGKAHKASLNKDHRHQRNTESVSDNAHQGEAHQLVIQYQTANHENIKTNDIKQIDQFILGLYMCICNIYARSINRKRGIMRSERCI